mgnify:CR=1 FL=1
MASFKEAFAAARKAQGAGGEFTWKGKSYSTNIAGEKGKKKAPAFSTDMANKAIDKAAGVQTPNASTPRPQKRPVDMAPKPVAAPASVTVSKLGRTPDTSVAGRLGAMGAVHNDNYIGDIDSDGDGTPDVFGSVGTWVGDAAAMTTAQSLTDSFVTMLGIGNRVQGVGGWGTALDPSFAVPYGPTADDIKPPENINAGWYDATPGSPNLVGTTLKCRVLQIARLSTNISVFTANMTLGYAAFGATTPLFGYGSFTIPAPGAMALLGLAGAFGRRRRS